MSLTKSNPMTLLALFTITLCGATSLFETFGGDQAMFVVYASEINNGALLYRDLWDIKQPGIFLFYLAGGKLFGYTEFGIHLFELLYWLVFSAILTVTLKKYFRRPVLAQLTPLLTVGVYYAVSGSWHLTQVEGLIGFPLYLTMWAMVDAVRQPSGENANPGLLCLSGFAGGIVLVFKLMFLPIIVLFWLAGLYSLIARRNSSLSKVLFPALASILLGAAIPLITVIGYFGWHNALGVLNYASFEYPMQAAALITDASRLPELERGLRWFVIVFAPLLLLVSVGALISLINATSLNKHFLGFLVSKLRQTDLLTVNLIIWVLAGFGIVIAQRLSWWEYHFLLPFVPLGILAMKGIEAIYERAGVASAFFTKPLGKLFFIICVVLILTPTLRRAARKFDSAFFERINLPKEQVWMPRGDMDEHYQLIKRQAAFLSEPNNRPGKIFVCGQPLYYHLSKRSPALASNGWMYDMFLPEQWKQLTAELQAKPPPYIIVESSCYHTIVQKSPETLRVLKDNYHLRTADDNVMRYELDSKKSP